MNAIPFPVVAQNLGATSDGRVFTNTGAIIHLRSLFCEAMDLLRIQDAQQYDRIVRYLKPTAGKWTKPEDVLTRKTDMRSGGRTFNFVWQALNKNMTCNLEDERYLLNEVQSADDRQVNLVLHNRAMPESMIAGLFGRPITDIVDIDRYFSMMRGATIKDAANLGADVHITLGIQGPKGKP